jgi:hypothetical protein
MSVELLHDGDERPLRSPASRALAVDSVLAASNAASSNAREDLVAAP